MVTQIVTSSHIWPAKQKPAVFIKNYKNVLKYNGELYLCLKKICAHFNHFDIKQSIAQTNKN